MKLHRPVPILRIFDEQLALAHCQDYLGFRVDWTCRFSDDFPLFMIISREDCTLHLSEHHGDARPGAHLRIRVDGLEELHRSRSAGNCKHAGPGIEDKPWGDGEMSLADPFGNR